VSLQESWRARAEVIREQARPLSARVDEIKAAMERASEYKQEALMAELRQLNKQIGLLARDASNADMMARGDLAGLR
jgi:hypothetical protein